jgi:hypothetical protein
MKPFALAEGFLTHRVRIHQLFFVKADTTFLEEG